MQSFDGIISKSSFLKCLESYLRAHDLRVPPKILQAHFREIVAQGPLQDITKKCDSLGIRVELLPTDISAAPSPSATILPDMWVAADGQTHLLTEKDKTLWMDQGKLPSGQEITCLCSLKIDEEICCRELYVSSSGTLDWFWGSFRHHWWAYVQGGFAAALINIFSLIGTLYAMQIYDRVLPSRSTDTLIVLTTGVVIIYFFDLVMKLLRSYVLDHAGNAIDKDVSEKIFFHGLSIQMDKRPKNIGRFISELREHETVRDFMMSTAVFILSDIPFLILFILTIAIIGGKIVLIPIFIALVLIVVVSVNQWNLSRMTAGYTKELGKRSGVLIESIEGTETIKSLNAEYKTRKKWRDMTDALSRIEVKIKGINNLSSNLALSAQSYIYVAVLAFGAVMVQNNEMSPGALVACSLLSSRAVAPLTQLISISSRFHRVLISAKTIHAIMKLPVDRTASASYVAMKPDLTDLSLRGLSFTYGDVAQPSLVIDKLEIKAGERIAILGRTGSGKSTFLRVLSGLYIPNHGQILVDGLDLKHIDPISYRDRVGYLSQDVRLFDGTLKDNLVFGHEDATDSDIIEAVRIAGLDRLISENAKGLDMPIYAGGQNLSSGQRQSVGIARLILSQPRMFLMDEPTSSMDQQSEAEFIRNFSSHLSAKTTLMIVTHKPQILALVNRILVIDSGRIVMDGPRDAVLEKLAGSAKS